MHGIGALFRWLLDHDLIDEINLFTFPVIVGLGTRLFPDTGRDIALELVGAQVVTPSGVTIQVYHPAGRPRYGTATPWHRSIRGIMACLAIYFAMNAEA